MGKYVRSYERRCYGCLIYEGLAKDLKEAEELAASGKITFDSCHHHNAVGPMAGIITYSMPVWHVVNKTFGNGCVTAP